MQNAKVQTGIPKHQRIFVNRSLNFGTIKLIGFDMDHTLAPYNKEAFEALAFEKTLHKFIEAGYPEELSRLTYKHDFVIRGLMVDRERGNILKADQHKYVKEAYHGYRRLSKEERHTLYNQQSFKAQDFLSIDTFFSLSEVQLFVDLVEFINTNPGKIEKSLSEVYMDLRKFIDLSHADGSIKQEVLKDPEKFILKDKYLGTTLVRLIDAGKQLFLLTNSHYDYTDAIMQVVLDQAHEEFSSWKEYWDYIIVGASKPGFFKGSQPFFEVVENNGLLKVHSGPLQSSSFYFGGNATQFEKLTGFQGDEVLYVGDHIYGDIIRSKGSVNWRTMLVIKELDEEIPTREAVNNFQVQLDSLMEERENLDEELQKIRSLKAANKRQQIKAKKSQDEKKLSTLESSKLKLQARLEEKKSLLKSLEARIKSLLEDRSKKFHPVWGELMKVGHERSRFAKQVSNYACIYSSGVSNLRFYSPYKKFISYLEKMPHEDRG